MPLNFYGLALHSLSRGLVFPELPQILGDIHRAVRRCEESIEGVQDDDLEAVAAIIDAESELLEQLLGTAFVLAQVYITAVTSRVARLHDLAGRSSVTLSTTNGSKEDIRAKGSPEVAGTSYSRIETIHAFANYFKHGDEWPVNWDEKPPKQGKGTVQVITAVGARPSSSGNLRLGAEAVGLNEYRVSRLMEILDAWRKSLVAAYEKELRATGLMT